MAALHKAPLVYWAEGVEVLNSHACNVPLSSDIQLAIAHFKFYPGYLNKIDHALSNGCYYNGSIEYRILDAAVKNIAEWDLRSPATVKYESQDSVEGAGMMWLK
jgi:hypothetical protein